MNIKKICPLILTLLILSCGFKVASLNYNYSIIEMVANGDSKIAYKLKNKKLTNTKKDSENKISITLNINKNKSVKEKNIKNEITKYQIEIVATVQFESESKRNKGQFDVMKKGEYTVMEVYSKTLDNENRLVENLTDLISEEILIILSSNFNDT